MNTHAAPAPVMLPQDEDSNAEVTKQVAAITDPDAVLESAVAREAEKTKRLNKAIRRRLSPPAGMPAVAVPTPAAATSNGRK